MAGQRLSRAAVYSRICRVTRSRLDQPCMKSCDVRMRSLHSASGCSVMHAVPWPKRIFQFTQRLNGRLHLVLAWLPQFPFPPQTDLLCTTDDACMLTIVSCDKPYSDSVSHVEQICIAQSQRTPICLNMQRTLSPGVGSCRSMLATQSIREPCTRCRTITSVQRTMACTQALPRALPHRTCSFGNCGKHGPAPRSALGHTELRRCFHEQRTSGDAVHRPY